MPRKLTESELQYQKDFMYQKTISLIKEKGLQNTTLDDITRAALMAKGSFYHYYSSKEEFLYEVIKRSEKHCFDIMLSFLRSNQRTKEDVITMFEESFLNEECLFAYLLPEDLEYLLRKLPKEIVSSEQTKSTSNFQAISELLRIKKTKENYGTLSYLMDGLQSILRDPADYGEEGRSRAARKVINAIADFIMEEIDVIDTN